MQSNTFGLIDTPNKPQCGTLWLEWIRHALQADCGLLQRTLMATEKHLIYVRLSNETQFAPARHKGVQFSNIAVPALMTPGVVLMTSLCFYTPPALLQRCSATANAGAACLYPQQIRNGSKGLSGLKYQFLLLSFLDQFPGV